jgi:hypothetical protein
VGAVEDSRRLAAGALITAWNHKPSRRAFNCSAVKRPEQRVGGGGRKGEVSRLEFAPYSQFRWRIAARDNEPRTLFRAALKRHGKRRWVEISGHNQDAAGAHDVELLARDRFDRVA